MIKLPDLDWDTIKNGTKDFPVLYNFQKGTQSQIDAEISLVERASLSSLKKGQGPGAYEEAHRAFSTWRASFDKALGLRVKFVRIRNDHDISKLRDWCCDLLHAKLPPATYLKFFTDNLSRMNNFNIGKLSVRYVLSPNTTRSVIARGIISKKETSIGKKFIPNGRLNSYVDNGGIDSRIREKLQEVSGFKSEEWTDSGLLSIVECAKSIKNDDGGFIDPSMRSFAEAIMELV